MASAVAEITWLVGWFVLGTKVVVVADSDGGSGMVKININSPSEYLTGISGTFGQYLSSTLIKSIMFHTNISHHGPIVGSEKETADEKFSFIMQGGVVVGFHGFSGLFLDSIGLYVMPCNSLLS
ncbi:hypothetical protein BC332_06697 [Capsicum chinense]|nr:hypothetical protein BC332_06697 [Capsicum chinense]